MRYAVAIARRAWAGPDQVLNTLPLSHLLTRLTAGNQGCSLNKRAEIGAVSEKPRFLRRLPCMTFWFVYTTVPYGWGQPPT